MKAQRDDPDLEFKYWETLTMPIYHLDDEPLGVKEFMMNHITKYYPGTWELYAKDWRSNDWIETDAFGYKYDNFMESFENVQVVTYTEKVMHNFKQGDSYHKEKMTIGEMFEKMKKNMKSTKKEITFVGNQIVPDEVMEHLEIP